MAHHRSDAATIADEALDPPSDQIASRQPIAAAQPEDGALSRQIGTAAPSKLLVSGRLMPQALLNRAHQALRGLQPEDA